MNGLHFLSYGFIQRAYLAGSLVAGLCGILGLFLVLRRLSLIGDGLSHVSFGAIALGLLLGVYPFYIAVPVAIVASWLILRLSAKTRISGDAAIGIVSSVGVAVGVVLASLARGFNVDLFSFLFGSILAVSLAEMWLAAVLSLAVLLTVVLFYRDLFAVTFDEEHARISGVNIGWIDFLFTTLTAIAVVLAVRIVGVMLVSALLVIPASASLQLARSFRGALLLSGSGAILAVLIGVSVSFAFSLPAGATVVLVSVVLLVLAYGWRRLRT